MMDWGHYMEPLKLHTPYSWSPEPWKPLSRFKIPHKCYEGHHWFWGPGVYRMGYQWGGDSEPEYRCQTCHTAAILAGEERHAGFKSLSDRLYGYIGYRGLYRREE